MRSSPSPTSQTRIEAEIDEFDVARAIGSNRQDQRRRLRPRMDRNDRRDPRLRHQPPSQAQDPSKPIDTRVLLVKVAFAEPTPLKLGQRVEVKID
jgi:hypothetical protein